MAEHEKPHNAADGEPGSRATPSSGESKGEGSSSTATAKPKRGIKRSPKKKPPGMLPPWKVLLHNDDKNSHQFVTATIVQLTPLNEQEAQSRMVEADKTGVALILVTHKERAELYKDQFESKGLTVTIEPDER